MEEIKMVDLKGQYIKIKEEVDSAINKVLDITSFINGPEVGLFCDDLAKYQQCKHVIPCANGTDALQIAMMALDLKPGDEVITTDFTFIATVEVIALLRLKPILVDVDPFTFNIDLDCIKKAITPKTKAIVPVHIFGQCADMEKIIEIADEHGLFVIEDNAQAIGADYHFTKGSIKKSGTIGHIGCTSFFPSKNLGCYGDGGAIFTNDDQLAEVMQSIVNHGMKVRYYHDRVGVNSRLDTIQAAILRIKLAHLDEYCKARQLAAATYNDAFKWHSALEIPSECSFSTHVYHQYTLKTIGIDRNGLQTWLQSNGIPAPIYYPVPSHAQKAFLEYRDESKNFPVTESLCESVISLPMHTELQKDQQDYIIDRVIKFIKR